MSFSYCWCLSRTDPQVDSECIQIYYYYYYYYYTEQKSNDYNAQIFKFLQNWSMFVELITKEGREFHNLIDDGKKENL